MSSGDLREAGRASTEHARTVRRKPLLRPQHESVILSFVPDIVGRSLSHGDFCGGEVDLVQFGSLVLQAVGQSDASSVRRQFAEVKTTSARKPIGV